MACVAAGAGPSLSQRSSSPTFTAELNVPCVRAVVHSYNAAAIRRLICRRFGTEPEPTGLGPNQIQY